EKNILNVIKFFDSEDIILPIDKLKNFFFDKSQTPQLLRDVFLTDLENRGLISINKTRGKEVISISKINEEDLKEKLKDLKEKIKPLKIADKNFYHIYTIKQKGYSLVYLTDFIDELENLLSLKTTLIGNKYSSYVKKMLFLRIYYVFIDLLTRNFLPLDIELSNFSENLKEEKKTKLNLEYIKEKLTEFGLDSINIDNFPELMKFNQEFSNLINILENPIDIKKLEERAKEYHKINKDLVNVQGEPFSFKTLQQNKNKKFKSPYFNLIYYDLKLDIEKLFNSPVILKLNNIYNKIKEIKNNYTEIKAILSGKEYKTQLTKTIYQKTKTLSNFKFIKPSKNIEDLNDLLSFLDELKKNVSKIYLPIQSILGRHLRTNQYSLLDNIYFYEEKIEEYSQEINKRLSYLENKKIYNRKKEILNLKNFRKLNILEYVNKIDNCQELVELMELTNEIFHRLNNEIDYLKNILEQIEEIAFTYFKTFKDLRASEKVFKSFNMNSYVEICKKYQLLLNKFKLNKKNLTFIDLCENLLGYKDRIEKGFKENIEKKFDKITREIYLKLIYKFESKKSFNKLEFNEVIKKFNLSNEEGEKILNNLIENNLIEKRYHFT
ncbi:MAG: hypothetical protein ACTSPW_16950, partial [Promethearchaeota archaeon]